MAQRLTQRVHDMLAEHLQAGDVAVDATVGNGHDTVWLAQCVGPTGHVYGFDIQSTAIRATRSRVADASIATPVTLFSTGHETMQATLAQHGQQRAAAVVFNLGYLPGGDKTTTTQPDTTLLALAQALELLSANGLMTIMSYRGHQTGAIECSEIEQWFEQNKEAGVAVAERFDAPGDGPVLFVLRRRAVNRKRN